jgi:hypothetical protein
MEQAIDKTRNIPGAARQSGASSGLEARRLLAAPNRIDRRPEDGQGAALAALSRRVERLTVSHRNPEAFYAERSEIADALRRMAGEAYARQAKDRDLIDHATEIRLRAERRAGELLREMRENGERDSGSGDRQSEKAKLQRSTQLSDLGVTKTQSSRWQKLARLDDDAFEKRMAREARA